LIYRFAEFALDVKPCNLRRNGVLHQIKRICSAFVLSASIISSAAADDSGVCLNGNSPVDAAIAACSRLIADKKIAHPRLAIFYNQRGVAWLRKQQFDQALEDLDMSIKLDPTDAGPYANRGYAFDGKGDVDHAIAEFDQAIKLGASDANVFNQRGGLWFAKHDYNRAISDFDLAIRGNPNWADFYYHRARAFQEKGDLDRAIADYNHAIRLDTKDAAY